MNLQALAASGSYASAAEMLSCSQSNIRILLANLEFELGRFVSSDSVAQHAASNEEGRLKLLLADKKSWHLTPVGMLTCSTLNAHVCHSSMQLTIVSHGLNYDTLSCTAASILHFQG